MARMIPSYISDDIKSVGERQIFEMFKNDPETSDWIVIHSLGLSKHEKNVYGEIDFVVLAPGYGIFCLEVKSGRIERKDGVWRFINRYNHVTEKTRGPFEQAIEGMHSLKKAIQSKFGSKSEIGNSFFSFGVMFPHIHFDFDTIDHEPWQVYDKRSCRYPISTFIKILSNNMLLKLEETGVKTTVPSESVCKQIADFLRGDFELFLSWKQMSENIEYEMIRCTEEQYACLDSLELNDRKIFNGGAGTGKTMIAIESAKRSYHKGYRTLFVCFNIILASWISKQIENMGFSDKIKVINFHKFMGDISGIEEKKLTIENEKQFYEFELPLAALDAIDNGKVELFDKLIIDEGQDLITDEYLDVFNSLLKGGLAGGKWEIFGDFIQQNIYSELSEQKMVEMIKTRTNGNFVTYKLTVNCRNTKNIGTEISYIAGSEKPRFSHSAIDGIPVEYILWDEKEEQKEKLSRLITKLKNNKVENKDIAILSFYSYKKSIVNSVNNHKIINLKDNIDKIYDNEYITFSSISAFKGLEKNYIIVTDIEYFMSPTFRSLFYVGTSRAKIGLFVMLKKSAYDDLLKLKKGV